ncbi:MAG: hypothetical protein R3E72_10490 [Steroidobacteraceae bacterium]
MIAERRAKLAALREQAGANSGAASAAGSAFPNDFRRDALAAHLLAAYADKPSSGSMPTRLGCALALRCQSGVMGAKFRAPQADGNGRLQIFLQRDTLGAAYDAFKS